jgi:hypothetical protein
VNVVADLPAGARQLEAVQQREGLLHHLALDSQAGAVAGAAPRIAWVMPLSRTGPRYLALVSIDPVWPPAGRSLRRSLSEAR